MTNPVGKKLENFQPKERRGAKVRYPYATWFDGEAYQLTQGEQFTCTPGTMTENIRQQARKRGLNVSVYGVEDDPKSIVVQCKNPPAPAKGKPGVKAAGRRSPINEVIPQGCRGSLKERSTQVKKAS